MVKEKNQSFIFIPLNAMKQFTTAFVSVLIAGSLSAQKLSQINLTGNPGPSYFAILTDQDVLIRITAEGKILDWGTELLSQRANFYDRKLQPFMGRVEYYGQEADSAFRGKVKSIGTCPLTYYGHYEIETKVGKLKSIGTLYLDYYSNFDNAALRGKLRFIGSLIVEYYSSLEDELFRGRLKTVGNVPIRYYSTFDDRYLKGKIKSIGSMVFDYYSSLDPIELRGYLKSGYYRPNIGGVTYILQ
jgi:hypothetical protein